jgi:hypothetical protein
MIALIGGLGCFLREVYVATHTVRIMTAKFANEARSRHLHDGRRLPCATECFGLGPLEVRAGQENLSSDARTGVAVTPVSRLNHSRNYFCDPIFDFPRKDVPRSHPAHISLPS